MKFFDVDLVKFMIIRPIPIFKAKNFNEFTSDFRRELRDVSSKYFFHRWVPLRFSSLFYIFFKKRKNLVLACELFQGFYPPLLANSYWEHLSLNPAIKADLYY